MSDDETSQQQHPPAKKPYTKPVLQDWGTLEELTQSQGIQGKKDGGFLLWSRTR